MIGVTAGGVTVGLALLATYLIKWWPGIKSLQASFITHLGRLLPFISGAAYGALGALSVMGLIGWFFDTVIFVSNWLGDVALLLGVGAKAGMSAQGSYLPLTQQGSYMVALLTAVVLAVIRWRACGPEVKRGAVCGALLGTSAGVAGLVAVPLAQAANWAGATVYGGV